LFGDLDVAGDDGAELLVDFGRHFGIDMSQVDPSIYFGTEGLPIWFPLAWVAHALRKGTPEQRARVRPVRIGTLVESARQSRWIG
jgi:hypothetical protein